MLLGKKGDLPVVNVLTFTDTGRAQHGESNEKFDCFPSLSLLPVFRAAAPHSELLATKRRDCLGLTIESIYN